MYDCVTMRKPKRRTLKPATLDIIKAMKRGERESEQDLLGPGFHSHNRIHRSAKSFSRKRKHKGNWGDE